SPASSGNDQKALRQPLRRSRLHLAKALRGVLQARPATNHQAQKESEKQADADDRQTPFAQTSADRNRQRPAQEHLPDRAHASSLENQFPGQLAGSSDRLHLSGEKASLDLHHDQLEAMQLAGF